VEPHPLGSREEIHPAGVPREVLVAQNRLVDGDSVRNDIWHTDLSCMRGRGVEQRACFFAQFEETS